MSKKFIPTSISWKHVFVKQSNLIDPQPGYPGSEPGQLMFDNHLVALDFAISDGWELSEHTPLDLHRLLTKNIDFFENSNYSGRYRTQDVWIGHEVCPHFIKIPEKNIHQLVMIKLILLMKKLINSMVIKKAH